jgi:PST family polysaccharide transporter
VRHADANVGGEAARGFLWASVGTIGAKGVSFVALALLARLLAPAEFGVFAVALLSLTYLETVADLGTGMALVYWPDRVHDAAQITFVVNLVMGAALTGLTLAAAPAVAAFFRSPESAPLLRALAWTFVLRGFGNTHDALCRKELRFRARLVPELGLASIKALFATTLAILGFGAWSLVWGQLAGTLTWSLLLWRVVPWRPALRWPRDLLRPILGYSSAIVAINLMSAVTHHADALVVGRLLGSRTLGFYQMGGRLPELTVALLVWQGSKVLFPAFARVRARGGDTGAAYLASLRYLSIAALPLAAALCLLAEPVVLIAFGPTWLPSVPVLRALALYAGVRAIGSPTGDVLKALGRPALLAGSGVLKIAVLLPALLLGARWGAGGVATSMMCVSFGIVVFNLGFALRLVRVPVRRLMGSFRESVPVTIAVTAALASWQLVAGASPLVALVGAAPVALGAAALTLRAVNPTLLRDVVATLRDRAPSGADEKHEAQPPVVRGPVEASA